MFTGIIQAVGQIQSIQPQSGDLRLFIATGKLNLADVSLGDSIAVNGVCLTVAELTASGFAADVSKETLSLTSLGQLKTGSQLNLEKSLTLQSLVGGHLVSGHVDGLGTVMDRQDDARSVRFRIQAPEPLLRYIAHKGSITVDGTSLTVNAIAGAVFELNIIPHTLQQTIMGNYRSGDSVNLEVDLVARYLERLLLSANAMETPTDKPIGVTQTMLADAGFKT